MTDWNDYERVLERFRNWLGEVHGQSAAGPSGDGLAEAAAPELRPVGLYQVVEEFTALRHEVKLQTRADRQLYERAEELMAALQQAVDEFHAIQPKEAEAARSAAEPLAHALVNLDEALERGHNAVETARRRITGESVSRLREALADLYRREPWWRRWACRRYYAAIEEVWFRQAADVHRAIFDSLVEGYELIHDRLRRTMRDEQIQRIECVGEPADPHCMTVVELVDDSRRRAGTVIEELRPGYFWKGRVLRFAEVKAAGSGGFV